MFRSNPVPGRPVPKAPSPFKQAFEKKHRERILAIRNMQAQLKDWSEEDYLIILQHYHDVMRSALRSKNEEGYEIAAAWFNQAVEFCREHAVRAVGYKFYIATMQICFRFAETTLHSKEALNDMQKQALINCAKVALEMLNHMLEFLNSPEFNANQKNIIANYHLVISKIYFRVSDFHEAMQFGYNAVTTLASHLHNPNDFANMAAVFETLATRLEGMDETYHDLCTIAADFFRSGNTKQFSALEKVAAKILKQEDHSYERETFLLYVLTMLRRYRNDPSLQNSYLRNQLLNEYYFTRLKQIEMEHKEKRDAQQKMVVETKEEADEILRKTNEDIRAMNDADEALKMLAAAKSEAENTVDIMTAVDASNAILDELLSDPIYGSALGGAAEAVHGAAATEDEFTVMLNKSNETVATLANDSMFATPTLPLNKKANAVTGLVQRFEGPK